MLFPESQTLERTSFQPALWRRLAYVQQQLLATASVLQMLLFKNRFRRRL